MGVSRGSESTMVSERGQSTLIGIVLLIGIVAIGSLGIFLVAGDAIGGAEQQSEQERVQQTFVSLSHGISTATASDDVSHSLELEAGEHGAIAHHDSATYEIWAQDYSGENRTDISSGTIGTIEYESDDGTKIAYEGGGVFHETGERTRVVSAPAIDYDSRTYTLSFPVVTLTEEKTIRSGDIRLTRSNVEREPRNYVANDHVFVEVESEYCLGWEEYFVEQAGDLTVQQACYGAENDDGKLKVRLGYNDISGAFSSGVALPSEENIDENPSGHDLGDIAEAEYPPLDETIQQLSDDFRENESVSELDSDSSNSAGEYYQENLNGEYDFDLTDGNAVVVVNDSVTTDGEGVTVSNCGNGEHSLKIYAQGDFELHDDVKPTCDNGSIKTIQLYGTSTSTVDFHDSSSTFEGLLYVASDEFDPENEEYQIDFSGAGNVGFNGSIVANSIKFGSATNSVNPIGLENSNVDIIPEGYEPAPQLTYLNLAEHEIDIENN
ncbi:DUF7289 family protein [Natronorubrum aibiense]|uniref:DUF7289 family protein n=1 Tax=Natronorubrum aibiense TaxID=348826 RepID=UPI00374357C6